MILLYTILAGDLCYEVSMSCLGRFMVDWLSMSLSAKCVSRHVSDLPLNPEPLVPCCVPSSFDGMSFNYHLCHSLHILHPHYDRRTDEYT
jgi:hypothetical protein